VNMCQRAHWKHAIEKGIKDTLGDASSRGLSTSRRRPLAVHSCRSPDYRDHPLPVRSVGKPTDQRKPVALGVWTYEEGSGGKC
jgi:hypothetical protein